MQRKTINDGLKGNECRWVYDTKPATFCCQDIVNGSYCAEHAKLVYLPAPRAKRRMPTMLPVDPIAPSKGEEPTEHRVDLVEALNPEG